MIESSLLRVWVRDGAVRGPIGAIHQPRSPFSSISDESGRRRQPKQIAYRQATARNLAFSGAIVETLSGFRPAGRNPDDDNVLGSWGVGEAERFGSRSSLMIGKAFLLFRMIVSSSR
jgi:hypothetical protein